MPRAFAMFEDAQEFVALKESLVPGRPAQRSQLFMRCTANAASSISDTYVPNMCYDSRGCCNTARASTASAGLDEPISSRMTLDANALTTPPRLDE